MARSLTTGEVQTLESGESESEHSNSIKLSHFGDAGETIATVKKRAKRSFNILGFFGCCFRCKHDPTCTETCMRHHHIQNGFNSEQAESRAMTHERLVQTSSAIAF